MNLQEYLKHSKMDIPAFAKALGVTPACVYNYVSGRRVPPKKIMKKIIEHTGNLVLPNDFYITNPVSFTMLSAYNYVQKLPPMNTYKHTIQIQTEPTKEEAKKK